MYNMRCFKWSNFVYSGSLEYWKTLCSPFTSTQAMARFVRVGEEETGRGDNPQSCSSYLWEQLDCKEKIWQKRLIECLLNEHI